MTSTRIALLGGVALLVLAAPAPRAALPPAGAAAATAAARAIDAYVAPMLKRGDLSGQLLVLRGGRVIVERSWGKANTELGVAVTPETRFNIASVTKPMTGVLAVQMIEEGRIGAEDSIARWIPNFPKGDSIRVSHLLRHRSGIPHETVPDSEMVRPFTAAEIVERARRLPLDFPVGSRNQYSSGGYEVLARVLELASGRSYAELLEERILEPLQMTHTGHIDSRMLVPGRASAYVPGPRGLENAPLQDFSALVGAGSVWSTARDLHRFVAGLAGGKLGAGPRASLVRAGGVLDLNGRTGGFKAWALWDSASTLEAIFVGNVSTGAPDALKRAVLRLAAGESVEPPSLPALRAGDVPESELRRWLGRYQLSFGTKLDLHLENGVLYCNQWILLPATDGSMFSPRDYGIIRGVAGDDGRLARLDWVQGGETYPAPRVASAQP